MSDWIRRLIIELDKQASEQSKQGLRDFASELRKLDAAQQAHGQAVSQVGRLTEDAYKRMHNASVERRADILQEMRLEEALARRQREAANRSNFPFFLQFAAWPAANLANRAGAPGLANALFTAGDIAGVASGAETIKKSIVGVSDTLRAAGGPIGRIATVAGNLVGPLNSTASAFASVLAVAGPLVLAFVAISAIMEAVQKDAERQAQVQRDQARRFLFSQVSANELVQQGGGSEDLNAFIRDRQQQLAARNLRMDDLAPLVAQFRGLTSGIGAVGRALSPGFSDAIIGNLDAQVSQMTGGGVTSIAALSAQFDELEKQTSDLNADIAAATALLGSEQVALNDARLAEQELTDLRLQAAQRNETFFQQTAQAESASADQIRTMIRARESEAALAQKQIDILEPLGTRTEEQNQLLSEARANLQTANDALDGLGDALNRALGRERLGDFIRNLTGGLGDTLSEIGQSYQDQLEAVERINDQFRDRQRNLERQFEEANLAAEAQYQFDEQKLKRDFEAQDLEDKIAADNRLRDLQQKRDDDREKALADHNRRLREIERDFQLAFQTAVGERDALAAYQAEQRRDKDIADENDRFNALNQERERDYERQKQGLAQNLRDQQAQRQRDYARRVDELRRQFEFERRERDRKYQTDIALLRQNHQRELNEQFVHYANSFNALRSHLFQRFGLEQQYYGAVVGLIQRTIGNLSGASGGSSIPYLTGNGATNPYIGYQGGRAYGGPVLPFRDVMVGENGPEILRLPVPGHVFTQQQYASMGASGNVNVVFGDIHGTNIRQIERVVDARLHHTLVKAGVAP